VAAWSKSSNRTPDGGACLEVADGFGALVPVRDSKTPHGPVLLFPANRWADFVCAVGGGGMRR
jgi:hypothetical protein